MNDLEWFAYIFIMPGLWLAGKKNIAVGWLMQFVGCLIFVGLAVHFEIWGIAFANILFAGIGLQSFFEQRKLQRDKNTR